MTDKCLFEEAEKEDYKNCMNCLNFIQVIIEGDRIRIECNNGFKTTFIRYTRDENA